MRPCACSISSRGQNDSDPGNLVIDTSIHISLHIWSLAFQRFFLRATGLQGGILNWEFPAGNISVALSLFMFINTIANATDRVLNKQAGMHQDDYFSLRSP